MRLGISGDPHSSLKKDDVCDVKHCWPYNLIVLLVYMSGLIPKEIVIEKLYFLFWLHSLVSTSQTN